MQVSALVAKAKQAAKLQAQLEQSTSKSQAADEARAAAEAKAQRRLQEELSSAIADTSAAQDALQIAQAELARVQEQVRARALPLMRGPLCCAFKLNFNDQERPRSGQSHTVTS